MAGENWWNLFYFDISEVKFFGSFLVVGLLWSMVLCEDTYVWHVCEYVEMSDQVCEFVRYSICSCELYSCEYVEESCVCTNHHKDCWIDLQSHLKTNTISLLWFTETLNFMTTHHPASCKPRLVKLVNLKIDKNSCQIKILSNMSKKKRSQYCQTC